MKFVATSVVVYLLILGLASVYTIHSCQQWKGRKFLFYHHSFESLCLVSVPGIIELMLVDSSDQSSVWVFNLKTLNVHFWITITKQRLRFYEMEKTKRERKNTFLLSSSTTIRHYILNMHRKTYFEWQKPMAFFSFTIVSLLWIQFSSDLHFSVEFHVHFSNTQHHCVNTVRFCCTKQTSLRNFSVKLFALVRRFLLT